ncbi:MAG: hypothetical protein OEV00_07275 [Acidobacteriota bacterium]|nr:hypothetical protein [Acidobacteriota bacterium]MDH3785114.1 hypothetical protein [Acidobacteriota bacterium]
MNVRSIADWLQEWSTLWPTENLGRGLKGLLEIVRMKLTTLAVITWLTVTALSCAVTDAVPQVRFTDDFEGDLVGWRLLGEHAIRTVDSGDPVHGRVLELQPDGKVLALIEGSDQWGGLSLAGEMLFPDDADNYLGFVYNYTESNSRSDFGSLYIKGNGSYIRANPWRDGNVSRLLYEEYNTPLTGDNAIRIGEWRTFRAEIVGNEIHLYVGDMSVPRVTFDLYEHASGLAGFGPRIVGYPVWIDNVTATSIAGFSYTGPAIPGIEYEASSLLTDWQVIGPLARPDEAFERANDEGHPWKPFRTDARGAVVTGRLTEYEGGRSVAYFRTTIESETQRDAVLHISTTDELALFVNDRFQGFVYRDGYISGDNDWNAWHDFWKNPEHEGRKVGLELQPGANRIVFRVRNGQFASGGFFAKLE